MSFPVIAALSGIAVCIALLAFHILSSPRDRWVMDMMAAGMSRHDAERQAEIRVALARLRRVASDAAVAGEDWEAAMQAEIAVTASTIPRGLGTAYLKIVKTLDVSDILFDDALAAIGELPAPYKITKADRAELMRHRKRVLEDERVAFRR